MAKKNFRLGIPVLALVLVMMVIGCGNEGEINLLDTYNLNNSAPTSEALEAGGIIQSQFDQIKNAFGGFNGWAIDEDEDLLMVWTGRSTSNYESMAELLDELFGEIDRESEDGFESVSGSNYLLMFNPSRISGNDHYLSAGTFILYLW